MPRIHPPGVCRPRSYGPSVSTRTDRERSPLAGRQTLEAGGGEPFREVSTGAGQGRESVVWVREEAVLVRDEAGVPLYWRGLRPYRAPGLGGAPALPGILRLPHRPDLPNRQLFMDRLGQALEDAPEVANQSPCCSWTSDNFKVGNSSWSPGGRPTSHSRSPTPQALPRPEDTLARFGGDGVRHLMIEAVDDLGTGRASSREDHGGASSGRSSWKGRDLYVIASIGISLVRRPNPRSRRPLLREADTACLPGQGRGRGPGCLT